MCVNVEHFIKINLWYKELETNSQWDVTGINCSPLSRRTEEGAEGLVGDGDNSQSGLWKSLCVASAMEQVVSGGFSDMGSLKSWLKTGRFSQGKFLSETKLWNALHLSFQATAGNQNQHFPFGIGCFLALFSKWKVQVLHCLLHVSLCEKATETTDNQGKQLEEITTFSLIKRNVPNSSSALLYFWEPVTFSLQEVLSSHCQSQKVEANTLIFQLRKAKLKIHGKTQNPCNILLGFSPPAFSN